MPGVVCAVLTADCLPVLFADRAGGAVGAAHAGWRGLAARRARGDGRGARRARRAGARALVAWLGPAIGPRAFEVGRDVVDAFCAGDPAAGDALRAAGPTASGSPTSIALARRRLAAAGVVAVTGGGHCTFTERARFFSYRRERDTGRQAAFVWRTIATPATL